jgi:hypothetical protein
MSSPEDAVWRTDHATSLWLDLAEGRLRLDRLSRNDDRETFFPCRPGRHSSRDKKVSPSPSSTDVPAQAGASSIASG